MCIHRYSSQCAVLSWIMESNLNVQQHCIVKTFWHDHTIESHVVPKQNDVNLYTVLRSWGQSLSIKEKKHYWRKCMIFSLCTYLCFWLLGEKSGRIGKKMLTVVISGEWDFSWYKFMYLPQSIFPIFLSY